MNSQKDSRMSQRRRQKQDREISAGESSPTKETAQTLLENCEDNGEDDGLVKSIHLEQVPTTDDADSSSQDETSPLKSCKKSPVKRMKKLEEQQNMQDEENIETTYKKSPERDSAATEPKAEEVVSKISDEHDAEQAEASPKSLLKSKDNLQEPVKTQTQEERSVVDITDILDVDSNVINYGQFICGKILGSTLLLTNISSQDQIVTMGISKR